jgi:hypothetical protein
MIFFFGPMGFELGALNSCAGAIQDSRLRQPPKLKTAQLISEFRLVARGSGK